MQFGTLAPWRWKPNVTLYQTAPHQKTDRRSGAGTPVGDVVRSVRSRMSLHEMTTSQFLLTAEYGLVGLRAGGGGGASAAGQRQRRIQIHVRRLRDLSFLPQQRWASGCTAPVGIVSGFRRSAVANCDHRTLWYRVTLFPAYSILTLFLYVVYLTFSGGAVPQVGRLRTPKRMR
jgi:hypothetical protein